MLPDHRRRLEEQKRRLRLCRRRMRLEEPSRPAASGRGPMYVLLPNAPELADGEGRGARLLTAADCSAFLAELARREFHVSLWEASCGLRSGAHGR